MSVFTLVDGVNGHWMRGRRHRRSFLKATSLNDLED